jgi:hypothetical protein
MAERLSATEVAQGAAEHAQHHRVVDESHRRDRVVSIAEAILLSLVTITAAWSGYAAAKWSTESSVHLAKASAERAKSNRANLQAMQLRNFDASTFNAWFSAYSVGNPVAMKVARHRFRPEFAAAFDAWRATEPETNPSAPPGPTYMPQYRQPLLAQSVALERSADEAFAEGQSDGATSDKYIRTTVILASVLFLVGISSHFPVRGGRYGLVALGVVLLVVSLVELLSLPGPPG